MRLDKKNKVLLLGLLFALYISYAFAVSNTIEYYKEYKAKQEILTSENNIPQLLNQLVQKEKQLDKFVSHSDSSISQSFQNNLLRQLNAYSESYSLKIIDFQQPHTVQEKGVTTLSYIFTLEGTFNGCLAVINKIENNPAMGNIQHINFKKTKNYKTNTEELKVEIIMQKE